jgi:outer membrane protein assembly factor BamB
MYERNTFSRIIPILISILMVIPSVTIPVKSEEHGRAYGDAAWALYGHDRRHTSLSSNELSAVNVTIKWKYPFNNIIPFSPVVGSDGTIYSGSYDMPRAIIYAINPDGTLKWKYTTTDGCNTYSPAIDKNGIIYVGTIFSPVQGGKNHLWAINPDGTKKWAFEVTHMTSGINIGDDGTIYFGAGTTFYALTSDEKLKWKYELSDVLWGTPAIANDGTIYLTLESGILLALNPDGSKKWDHSIGGYPSDIVVDNDGTIYVAKDFLYALNPDGTMKWTWNVTHGVKSPSIGPDGVLYLITDGAKVFAVFPNGTVKWKYTLFNPNIYGLSRPIIDSSGVLYFTANDYNLSKSYVVSINGNGTLRWQISMPSPNNVGPPVMGDDGTLYISSHDHNIYAIGGPEPIGPPSPPRNVVVIPGDGFVDITWDRPKNMGGSKQVTYTVLRGTSSGSTSILSSVGANVTKYHDASVTNGEKYFYNLKAKNEYGDSDLAFDSGKEPFTIPQVDNTPPALEIYDIMNGTKITKKTVLRLMGNSSDNVAVSKVEVSLDDKNWEPTNGSVSMWSFDVKLKDGTNTVYVRATDYSGNTAMKSVTFIADVPKQGGPTDLFLGVKLYVWFLIIVVIILLVVAVTIMMLKVRKRRLAMESELEKEPPK